MQGINILNSTNSSIIDNSDNKNFNYKPAEKYSILLNQSVRHDTNTLIKPCKTLNNTSNKTNSKQCSKGLNDIYYNNLSKSSNINKLTEDEIRYYKLIQSKSRVVVNRIYQLLKSCNGDLKVVASLFPEFSEEDIQSIYIARTSRQKNKDFTTDDDKLLFEKVNEYGINFKKIARYFKDKTPCDLKRRYFKLETLNSLITLNKNQINKPKFNDLESSNIIPSNIKDFFKPQEKLRNKSYKDYNTDDNNMYDLKLNDNKSQKSESTESFFDIKKNKDNEFNQKNYNKINDKNNVCEDVALSTNATNLRKCNEFVSSCNFKTLETKNNYLNDKNIFNSNKSVFENINLSNVFSKDNNSSNNFLNKSDINTSPISNNNIIDNNINNTLNDNYISELFDSNKLGSRDVNVDKNNILDTDSIFINNKSLYKYNEDDFGEILYSNNNTDLSKIINCSFNGNNSIIGNYSNVSNYYLNNYNITSDSSNNKNSILNNLKHKEYDNLRIRLHNDKVNDNKVDYTKINNINYSHTNSIKNKNYKVINSLLNKMQQLNEQINKVMSNNEC